MGVYLRGFHIGMAEQLLYHPDIGARLKQVCRKGMAQGMARYTLVGSNLPANGESGRTKLTN